MNKKNSAMTALLALALVVSPFSTTRVHADDTMNKVDENAIVETQSSDEEFKFTVTAPETPWDGISDLVLTTNATESTIQYQEAYVYSDGTSLGGLMYLDPTFNINSNGVSGDSFATFKKEDLLNAQLNGENGPESVDWTKVDQIEFSFYYAAISGSNSQVTVYVPVKFKTPTAVSNSGVSMMLPATAPEGLEFKANVTDGADEKDVVEKVAQIDGNKIQTFDLSLLLNGEVYDYNGQFESTVSLPISDGWDVNQLALYYYNEETKELTPVDFTVDTTKGMVVFTTNHFSKYVLVQKFVAPSKPTIDEITKVEETTQTTQTSQTTVSNPDTSDSTNMNLYASLLLGSGLLIVAFMTLGKKKVL